MDQDSYFDQLAAPRRVRALIGHEAALAVLMGAFRSGRLHHAWLLSGPRGIGKASLAYRFAWWVLSGAPGDGATLPACSPDDPVRVQIAALGHPALRVLQIDWDREAGRPRTRIVVEQVRALAGHLNLSSLNAADWRVVIVDSVCEMNVNAANALLKILEEPPARTVFLLVCHAPGQVPATVRSRALRLPLRPLSPDQIAEALRQLGEAALAPEDAELLHELAGGSVGAARQLSAGDGLAMYRDLLRRALAPPRGSTAASHELADRLARRGAEASHRMWMQLVALLLMRLVQQAAGNARIRLSEREQALARHLAVAETLDRWMALWEKVADLTGRVERLNLDRKQAVLSVLFWLARESGHAGA